MLTLSFVHASYALWWLFPFMTALAGIVNSTSAGLFTDLTPTHLRGEVLGIMQSLQSVAAGATFMLAGSLAANFPLLPVVCGALALFAATAIWSRRFRRALPLPLNA